VWTRSFQGHVLSSYFYGYLVTMFLGGWLSGRYGGKHVLGVGLLVSSVATMLIPPAVRLNECLIIVLRVIIGLSAVSCHSFIFATTRVRSSDNPHILEFLLSNIDIISDINYLSTHWARVIILSC
jgi:MFS family permease